MAGTEAKSNASNSGAGSSGEITQVLRKRTAQLLEGSRMPSVRDLMREFGVGQTIVQRALDELEGEGVLIRQVGRGTFVAKNGESISRTVTILHSDYPSRRGQEIFRHLNAELRADNHKPFSITYPNMDAAIELLRAAPRSDAFVLQPMSNELPLRLLAFLKRRADAVVVDGEMRGVDVDSADTDWLKGLELALQYLIDKGHGSIALGSGEPTEYWDGLITHFERIRQWSADPQTFGPVITSETQPGESSAAGMRDAISRLLKESDGELPFTALVVSSFASATGAMEALSEAGVSVPRDVSLLVMDNPDLGAATFPQLTMIGDSSERIAARIVERIERRWADPEAPHGCVYDTPEIVERASVGPPRSAP